MLAVSVLAADSEGGILESTVKLYLLQPVASEKWRTVLAKHVERQTLALIIVLDTDEGDATWLDGFVRVLYVRNVRLVLRRTTLGNSERNRDSDITDTAAPVSSSMLKGFPSTVTSSIIGSLVTSIALTLCNR